MRPSSLRPRPRPHRRSRLPALAGFVAAVSIVSACASFGDSYSCPEPTVGITDSAVVAFFETVEPPPRRFLIATADYGDSALPEAATRGMYMEGPTYMYPNDSALTQQVRDRLVRAGPFPAILIFYHGMEPLGDSAVDVTFSGRFVTGAQHGMVVPHKSVRMACSEDGTWQVRRPSYEDTTGAPS